MYKNGRKDYYEKNRDKILEYRRQWRKKRRVTHPLDAVKQNRKTKEYHKTIDGRAALKAGALNMAAKKRGQPGRVSKEDILILWNNKRCNACDTDKLLEIDHIIPSLLGGQNRGENLQLLCADCHKEKTRKDVSVQPSLYGSTEDQLPLFKGVNP